MHNTRTFTTTINRYGTMLLLAYSAKESKNIVKINHDRGRSRKTLTSFEKIHQTISFIMSAIVRPQVTLKELGQQLEKGSAKLSCATICDKK